MKILKILILTGIWFTLIVGAISMVRAIDRLAMSVQHFHMRQAW